MYVLHDLSYYMAYPRRDPLSFRANMDEDFTVRQLTPISVPASVRGRQEAAVWTVSRGALTQGEW